MPGFAPGDLERAIDDGTLLALHTPRTTTAILPAAEAHEWAAAHLPADERELRHIALHAITDDLEQFAAVDLAVRATREALADGPLSRDALHARLRDALPAGLLPWCDGCQTHSARRGLLVMVGLHGALALEGNAGRQPRFIDPHLPPADPGPCKKRLADRFCAAYCDADLAAWAGLDPAHGRRIMAAAPERKKGLRVVSCVGVRLLMPGDPGLRDPRLEW